MENALIRGQYKIVRVLRTEEEFAAVMAVDILDRAQPFLLLNLYENKAIRRYAPVYEALRHCPEYRGVVTDGESMIAIFAWNEGRGFDQLFHRGADIPWNVRLQYAQELFALALSLWSYPTEIACAALLSDNLLVRTSESRLAVNYVVAPVGALDRREPIFLLIDQAKKILIDRWGATDAERCFMQRLCSEQWNSMVPLYSCWLEARERIRAENEKLEKKRAIRRFLALLALNARWKKKKKDVD